MNIYSEIKGAAGISLPILVLLTAMLPASSVSAFNGDRRQKKQVEAYDLNSAFAMLYRMAWLGSEIESVPKNKKADQRSERFTALLAEAAQDYMKHLESFDEKRLPKDAPVMQASRELVSIVKAKRIDANFSHKVQDLEKQLTAAMRTETAPAQTPNYKEGQDLYEKHCATCHGNQGKGDGVLASRMSPAPLNFVSGAAATEASAFRLFSALMVTSKETAMPPFHKILSPLQLWDVSFYVMNLRCPDSDKTAEQDSLLFAKHRDALRLSGLNLAFLSAATDEELQSWLAKSLPKSTEEERSRLLKKLRRFASYDITIPRG